MVEHLDALGVRSHVFAPTYNRDSGSVIPNSNVTVNECFKYNDRVFYLAKQSKIQKSLNNSIDVSSYDVIHAYTLFSDGNTAMIMSAKYGIPYVVAIRDTDINKFYKYRPYLYWRGLRIMRNASCVFFLSETYKNLVLSKYVPNKYRKEIEKKSIIIPNGIDDYWFDNRAKEISQDHIERISRKIVKTVYIGEISKRKNVPMIVSACNELRKRGWDVSLTVVGKATDKGEVDIVSKDKNTTVYPPVNKESLIGYYRDADVFVMPSHTETFGLTYAEAMSQGIPVIYTSGQGFDGQFEEGVVGYSVNNLSKEDIAEKIIKITENYLTIAQNCISKCEAFRWNEICLKYKEVYKSILR
jgi:glycosyltransferase involved in cell wall biosynthesis